MGREEIIKILKEVNDLVRQRYKADIKGIFGSFARGEESDKSDIDILVEFGEGANLLHFVGLSLFLEEKLSQCVDIIPIDVIRKEIREPILNEAVYL